MHVLRFVGMEFDYMVGAQIEGFDKMVRLSHSAEIAIFEGDEYLSSPLDLRPKFHLYKPHIALLSGVAWDHINVFPTFENYVEQFSIFADRIEPNGKLVFFSGDEYLEKIAGSSREDIEVIPYHTHEHHLKEGITSLLSNGIAHPLQVFGQHNLQNINGARLVCNHLGIENDQFYKAIVQFGGAAKRLQLLKENTSARVYLDFAHSPSKLKATTMAVKEQFPDRELVACMELHTFSSLNQEFLQLYKGSMSKADIAIVYFDKHVLEHKKLKDLTSEQVMEAFGGNNVKVMNDANEFRSYVNSLEMKNQNLLLMSSGNFSGINFKELADKLIP